MSADEFDRRDFLKRVGSVGAGIALAGSAFAKSAAKTSPTRVLGANDKINIGVIGVGGRGSYVASAFTKYGDANNNACQIVAVCDVYEKRKALQAKKVQLPGLPGLPRSAGPPRRRRRGGRDARSLARQDRAWKRWTRAKTSISRSRCATPPRK